MKKMIIGVCAVAFAAVAQAATVNWSGSTTALTGKTSYYGYLVDASAYSSVAAAVEAIAASGDSANGVMYSAAGTYNSAQNKAIIAQSGKTLPSTYEAGQNVSYWSILFDGTVGPEGTAEHYYNLSATTDDAGKATSTKISAAGALTAANMNVTAGSWTSMSVPEPTSGLLLILGMAGLALRRRRA